MKRVAWAVVATAAAVIVVAGLAGQDDLRRFRRMQCM